MPHLIYAGRHWRISSDELSLPCLCAVAGRLFWSILLLIVIIYVYGSLEKCNNGWLILLFLILSFIGCLLSILCEFFILNISLKGSMVQTEKRVGINQYLSFHMYLGIMQFILALFGLLVTQNIEVIDIPCHDDIDKHYKFLIILTIVIISQLVDIFSQICCCFLFSAQKVVDTQIEERVSYLGNNEEAIQRWEGRCRTLCKSVQICSCNIFGGSNIGEDLEAVAKVLTNFFHHDGFLDVVPTDVVAGIILVRLQQRAIIKEKRINMKLHNNPLIDNIEEGKTSNYNIQINMNKSPNKSTMGLSQRSYNGNRDFDINSPEDKKTMEILSRTSVYALAMYTHLIVMYMKPCTGCCRLWHSRIFNIGCCNLCGTKNVFTKGDVDNCMPHLSAVRVLTSDLINSEVIHAAFYNNATAKPYAVFIDNDIESVVISIRGTLSLEDCMTDVRADIVEMIDAGEQWGFNGKGKFTHEGFLNCALNIRSDLDKYKVLEQIFGNSSDSGNLYSESSEWIYAKNYNLIVTGHSLGAGTASVLTYLLQKAYPKVKCYSFGTPSATFDRQTSLDSYPFITSVCMHNDIVCRLSVNSICELREKILDSISRSKVNKMLIMQSVFKEFPIEQLLYPSGEEPLSDFKLNVNQYTDKIKLNFSSSTTNIGKEINSYMAGRILHIQKSALAPKCICGHTKIYKIVEKSIDDFDHIIIGGSMLLDHFPDKYAQELQLLNHRDYNPK